MRQRDTRRVGVPQQQMALRRLHYVGSRADSLRESRHRRAFWQII